MTTINLMNGSVIIPETLPDPYYSWALIHIEAYREHRKSKQDIRKEVRYHDGMADDLARLAEKRRTWTRDNVAEQRAINNSRIHRQYAALLNTIADIICTRDRYIREYNRYGTITYRIRKD